MDVSDEPKLLQCLVALVYAFAREFVCPISLELPVDAVTTEDGRIYERSTIAWRGFLGRREQQRRVQATNDVAFLE